MSEQISTAFQRLEEELRSAGFDGTTKPLKRLRELRDLLAFEGRLSTSPVSPVKDESGLGTSVPFDEALDSLG